MRNSFLVIVFWCENINGKDWDYKRRCQLKFMKATIYIGAMQMCFVFLANLVFVVAENVNEFDSSRSKQS